MLPRYPEPPNAAKVVPETPLPSRAERVGLLAVCWVLLVLCAAAGLYRIGQHSQEIATLDWPTCEGVVIQSRSRPCSIKGMRGARPDVIYQYRVKEVELIGNRIGLSRNCVAEDVVAGILQQYPVGAKVTVSYDAGQPELSYLRPGPDEEHVLLYQLGIVFLACALVGMSLLVFFPGPVGSLLWRLT